MFSEQLLNLGRIHWYLVHATNLMDAKRLEPHLPGTIHTPTLTSFGREVEKDEINWWVFKREHDLPTLHQKAEIVRQAAQILKEAADKLRKSRFLSIESLTKAYELFAIQHQSEIGAILEYTQWLSQKDELAPSILFNYRTWGSTRMSDFTINISANDVNDIQEIEQLTLNVLGFTKRGRATIDQVRTEMEYELYETIDEGSDSENINKVSRPQVEVNTASVAVNQFYEYIELLRNSTREMLIDIEKRENELRLFTSDEFWQKFILKASGSNKTEQLYWDFKETLDMWQMPKGPGKKDAEHKFVERVAGFANNKGGVIIVGVTDSPPRKIVGLGTNFKAIEDYMKYTSKVIKDYLKYSNEFVHLQQVDIPEQDGNNQLCLVIAIRQTYSSVGVKGLDGKSFSYPIREETGLVWDDPGNLSIKKINVKSDNYNFLTVLRQFVYESA